MGHIDINLRASFSASEMSHREWKFELKNESILYSEKVNFYLVYPEKEPLLIYTSPRLGAHGHDEFTYDFIPCVLRIEAFTLNAIYDEPHLGPKGVRAIERYINYGMNVVGGGIFRKYEFEIGVEDTIPGHPKSDDDHYNPRIWIRTLLLT